MSFRKMYFQTTMMAWVMFCMVALYGIPSASAETSISARYKQPRGNHIQWKIKVPSPPPAAVLVIQYIIPGSEIISSSHPLSSYDKEKGVAKWLITSLSPGVLKMDMKVSKPIRKKGEIHGEVMFKDASQNTTASMFMKPKPKKRAVEGC